MKKNSTLKELIFTFKQALIDYQMIQKEDSILIGVSGGPDSIALVLAFLEIQKEYDLNLGIAHLNHCLRGEESQRDKSFTKEFAKGFKLPFFCQKTDVAAFAKEKKLSLEQAARKIRYRFFHKIIHDSSFTKIALGHNKDDNAELVLMNLLRGSGLKGLSGIPPVRDNIIRPLIMIPRTMIIEFLNYKNQEYVIDSSNNDTRFLRNRIRHELIPLLKDQYNPETPDILTRLSNVFKHENEFLDHKASSLFKESLIEQQQDLIILSVKRFSLLHPAMKNRVARKAIKNIKGDLKRISLIHIEDVLNLADQAIDKKSLDLPDQIRVYIKNDNISFKKESVPLRDLKRD